MAHPAFTERPTPAAMVALIAAQAFCALFFITDVLTDLGEAGGKPTTHLLIEAMAAATLVVAIFLETRLMLDLFARKARLETSLKEASRAVFDVIEAHFDDWALSPAERDVASFLVKGLSITEIAELRGNKEGTIKAHLNAIYRKSGTRNRAELMSAVIDTLIDADVSGDA
ncbi:helix-turn-helix transcriptional regulator [Celeribacter sp.]|uniref:helix-turn-helix transcriptional regulator n=1 Tax=Celeribacter sp. TaxID=1890673 RepID=UPI003A8D8ECC